MSTKHPFVRYLAAVLTLSCAGAARAGNFDTLVPVTPDYALSSSIYDNASGITPAGTADGSMVLMRGSGRIYVQRVDSRGRLVGAPIFISPVGGNVPDAEITTLAGGRIAVVYSHTPGSFSDSAVYVQILKADGSLAGGSQISGLDRRNAAIAALDNGNAAVVWADANSFDIYGRVISPSGTALGAQFQVSVNGNTDTDPSVAAIGSGFAVSFTSKLPSAAFQQISLRRFNASGGSVGALVRIDQQEARPHEKSIIAPLPNGGVAVMWESNIYSIVSTLAVRVDSTLKGIFVSANGVLGNRFTIDDVAAFGKIERGPRLVANGSGVLAGWSSSYKPPETITSSPIGSEARAAEVSAAGVIGPIRTLNASSNRDQNLTGLAILPSGTPVVTYSDLAGVGQGVPIGPRLTFMVPPKVNANDILGSSGSDPNLRGTARDDSMFGLGGNDRVFGLEGNDTISSGPGNDKLDGGFGRDRLRGGPGDDTYYVDNPLDIIEEDAGQGTDLVMAATAYTLPVNVENIVLTDLAATIAIGNRSDNTMTGNTANNSLHGLEGPDNLTAKEGDDTLDGGKGADTMRGGPGNDNYFVDVPGDRVIERAGEGGDSVFSAASYVLSPDVENLYLQGTGVIDGTGNDGANTIYGNDQNNTIEALDGNDYVYGLKGRDIIDGGTGVDVIEAGEGDDRITGGADRDLFIFRAGFGNDTITDFSLIDDEKVDVPGSEFPTTSAALLAAEPSGPNDTLIRAPSGATILLKNVFVNDLTSDNFSLN